ncbi:MAG TPA: ThuA domain-containing protein [Candidatus Acidoferrum sp.]|nr:ThuA domain-containing protein [Candidatus Acidoferrum sp.]
MKIISTLIIAACVTSSLQAAEPKPLRMLLITGGCCHDYKEQKDLLKKGLEERANIEVTQVHTDDKSTKPPLAIVGNPEYAKGFDLVMHDECAADISNPESIKGVLKPHEDGIPGVNLHCAMHSYRIGNAGQKTEAGAERAMWFDYLGLQSSGHGPQEPITLSFVDEKNPITRGLTNWTTIREELYNNVVIRDGARPLARGKQTVRTKKKDAEGKEIVTEKDNEYVVVWSNEFGPKKTRVFSTTIGHNNATVSDPRYLDLVTRGLLWACGKLDDSGKPVAGYGPKAQ